ncbi:hypothetical protein BDW02DRAFT_17687 [Decorospora gaudefroyi]|uniref:Uncharacterized protein n=1 Tax=Decorospora gaudefroyi TaxID=184978 RepID=A0A6A5K3J5_9PLEO|nr:hypothetical protein BDW02DRAFT_17687 [Decorospora gaudefroyi]
MLIQCALLFLGRVHSCPSSMVYLCDEKLARAVFILSFGGWLEIVLAPLLSPVGVNFRIFALVGEEMSLFGRQNQPLVEIVHQALDVRLTQWELVKKTTWIPSSSGICPAVAHSQR